MSEKRDLAIIGLLLGLIAGALVLADSLGGFGRNITSITIGDLLARAVFIILGIGILFGSVLIYRRDYSTGGILNLVLGILVIVLGAGLLSGVLALISGVLGLLAHEARS